MEPHDGPGFLTALEEELRQAKGTKPGGQPSNPDRVAVIEREIGRVRRAIRKAGQPEKAVVEPDVETR